MVSRKDKVEAVAKVEYFEREVLSEFLAAIAIIDRAVWLAIKRHVRCDWQVPEHIEVKNDHVEPMNVELVSLLLCYLDLDSLRDNIKSICACDRETIQVLKSGCFVQVLELEFLNNVSHGQVVAAFVRLFVF